MNHANQHQKYDFFQIFETFSTRKTNHSFKVFGMQMPADYWKLSTFFNNIPELQLLSCLDLVYWNHYKYENLQTDDSSFYVDLNKHHI